MQRHCNYFEAFGKGKTLQEVAEQHTEWSNSSIEEGAAFFFQAGFLQAPEQASSTRTAEQEDTLTSWLHITNACNLRCQYCYIEKTNESMTDDTARKAVDAVFRSAKKQGFKRVVLKYAGGEATLRTSSVLEVHDYALKQAQLQGLELSAHILSNGVVFPLHTIREFAKRSIGISISLDGINSVNDSQRSFANGLGSFQYVDRTIKRLLANGIIPHILVTISQRNLSGLADLMDYILCHNLTFSLNYYRDNECSTSIRDLQFSDKQMIKTMRNVFALIENHLPKRSLLDALVDKATLSTMHQHTCGVGRNYLVINQHGGIAKCQADSKQIVTTIDDEDPLQTIRSDTKGIQNIASAEKEGCKTCDWRFWCSGGCPLLTYRTTGRFDVKSPNCHIYQALIPEALRLEALRLLTYEEPIIAHKLRHELYALTV